MLSTGTLPISEIPSSTPCSHHDTCPHIINYERSLNTFRKFLRPQRLQQARLSSTELIEAFIQAKGLIEEYDSFLTWDESGGMSQQKKEDGLYLIAATGHQALKIQFDILLASIVWINSEQFITSYMLSNKPKNGRLRRVRHINEEVYQKILDHDTQGQGLQESNSLPTFENDIPPVYISAFNEPMNVIEPIDDAKRDCKNQAAKTALPAACLQAKQRMEETKYSREAVMAYLGLVLKHYTISEKRPHITQEDMQAILKALAALDKALYPEIPSESSLLVELIRQVDDFSHSFQALWFEEKARVSLLLGDQLSGISNHSQEMKLAMPLAHYDKAIDLFNLLLSESHPSNSDMLQLYTQWSNKLASAHLKRGLFQLRLARLNKQKNKQSEVNYQAAIFDFDQLITNSLTLPIMNDMVGRAYAYLANAVFYLNNLNEITSPRIKNALKKENSQKPRVSKAITNVEKTVSLSELSLENNNQSLLSVSTITTQPLPILSTKKQPSVFPSLFGTSDRQLTQSLKEKKKGHTPIIPSAIMVSRLPLHAISREDMRLEEVLKKIIVLSISAIAKNAKLTQGYEMLVVSEAEWGKNTGWIKGWIKPVLIVSAHKKGYMLWGNKDGEQQLYKLRGSALNTLSKRIPHPLVDVTSLLISPTEKELLEFFGQYHTFNLVGILSFENTFMPGSGDFGKMFYPLSRASWSMKKAEVWYLIQKTILSFAKDEQMQVLGYCYCRRTILGMYFRSQRGSVMDKEGPRILEEIKQQLNELLGQGCIKDPDHKDGPDHPMQGFNISPSISFT